MKLNTLFMAAAILAGLFSLSMLFAPEMLMRIYGTSSDTTGITMMRFFGSALAMMAVVSWLAKDADQSRALNAITTGFCISMAISCVVALIAQLGGVFNGLGWTTVALNLFFAATFGYHSFLKNE